MSSFFQLQSFWNFLKRNKLFTAINIFGFAVSLMFVILMGLYIQDELSVNALQPNKERIYRLTNEKNAYWPMPITNDILGRYPEIEATMRIMDVNWSITDGIREMKVGEMFLVDSSFVTMFDVQWVEGGPDGALKTRNDVILSEASAKMWFSGEQALGKTIRINGRDRIVSGVFRDLKQTHFKTPEAILRIENIAEQWPQNLLANYGASAFGVYVMTRPDVELTQEKLGEMQKFFKGLMPQYEKGMTTEVRAEPLTAVYYTNILANELRVNDKGFLMVLGATALAILLFAVINYINLSVAQSGFRAQEAATRRLLGGSKGSLFAGFILESLIICFVSLCIAVLLAALAEPWFQQVMWTKISVANSFTAEHILLALG